MQDGPMEQQRSSTGVVGAARQPVRRRTRKRKVAIALLLAVALAAVAGYVGAAVFVYDRVSRIEGSCQGKREGNTPARYALDPTTGLEKAAYEMPAYETVTFPSRDAGITVSGWFIPADEPGDRTVILVHGLGGCRYDSGMLLVAAMLHRHGFDVLTLDLRDHGDSTREDGRFAGGTDEYRDALGGWDWLRARGVPASSIGLFGASLGAATVLIATGHEQRVVATWEDSSYADLDRAIKDELRRTGYPTQLAPAAGIAAKLVSGDDITYPSPLDSVMQMGGRALGITHGSADRRISVDYAGELERAAQTAGVRVESWIVEGAEHTDAARTHALEYERRLTDFFARTLGR
jgi:dipeptidyl aminopeptidase/acylaminoacyl peptidase